MTVSVLALAIYFFIQARNSEAPPVSPTATAPALGSSSPGASFVQSPTPGASAVAIVTLPPTLTATAALTAPPSVSVSLAPVTPGPTVFVPPVMQGSGFITFGTIADSQFHVLDPKTTFTIDQTILWDAYLTEPANSDQLQIRVLKLDATQPSGQVLVRTDPVTPRANDIRLFFHRFKLNGAGPGLYTIQYVRGDQILSTGSFLVQ